MEMCDGGELLERMKENQTEIYNGGFESWYTNGKVQYPDQKGTSYWDSSNSGSASYIGSISVQETSFKHSGNSCAKLQTKNAIIKLAAGCIFTGKFNGLIETLDEAIKYPIVTNKDGGKETEVIIAGPTCDSMDIMYENIKYKLPVDLKIGDRLYWLSTGAYTSTYASVEFNGFPPIKTYYMDGTNS